jgi:hypothetical protein
VPKHHIKKINKEGGYKAPCIPDLALIYSEWLASLSGRFIPVERALSIHWTRPWYTQAFGGRLITAEARIRTQSSSCGIYIRQSDIGTGFSPSSLVSPANIIPPLLHIHSCIIWGMDNGAVNGRSSI